MVRLKVYSNIKFLVVHIFLTTHKVVSAFTSLYSVLPVYFYRNDKAITRIACYRFYSLVMNLVEQRVVDFVAATASKEPTPGGGAIAALTAATGAALAEMVANLTFGKRDMKMFNLT